MNCNQHLWKNSYLLQTMTASHLLAREEAESSYYPVSFFPEWGGDISPSREAWRSVGILLV